MDRLPGPMTIRAMAQRSRPRDLYDIVNLYRHRDLHPQPQLIRAALEQKCAAKGVAYPSVSSLSDASRSTALFADWEGMLAHQLPVLPPADSFWSELPGLFDWLDGHEAVALASAPMVGDIESTWSPPPTISTWGRGISLEPIRFAAANRLQVDLGYYGTTRAIEPYSLRRTRDGNLLLGAVRAATGEVRAYRVDRIQSVKITTGRSGPVSQSSSHPQERCPHHRSSAATAAGRVAFRASSPRATQSSAPSVTRLSPVGDPTPCSIPTRTDTAAPAVAVSVDCGSRDTTRDSVHYPAR